MGKRVKYIVTLASAERQSRTRLVKAGKAQAYRIKHANILLAAGQVERYDYEYRRRGNPGIAGCGLPES